MNGTGWAAAILALLLIGGGAWWYATQEPAPSAAVEQGVNATSTESAPNPTGETGSNTSGPTIDLSAGAAAGNAPVIVTYGANGFSPKTVTLARGGTVTFVNEGGDRMWVAADEHPTHTEYDGTGRAEHCVAEYAGAKPFDQCGTGERYSFTFTKAGSFDYHNHAAAQFGGVVIVQ